MGQALPYDAYDKHGKLLLRAGHVLVSDTYLERLIRFAYFDDGPTEDARPPGDEDSPDKRPLASILSARQRLHALLGGGKNPDFPGHVRHIAEQLSWACQANADLALASIVLQREGPYACRHMVNAAITCALVGSALELSGAEHAAVMAAALTMNVAMLDLQETLLAVDGPLDEAQLREIRRHCTGGAEWLGERGVTDPMWLQIVLDHHERPDGSGYPAGKLGDGIAMPARLLAAADVYCARVAGRRYRPPLQANVALRRLYLNEGARLDEKIATAFIKTLGVYPPGTGVRLRSGSIAVVTRRGRDSLKPQVSSITTHDGLRVGTPIRRRCNEEGHTISEVVDLEQLGLSVSMETLWGADAAI